MSNLKIPLEISGKGLLREDNLKQSIDSSVNMILTTYQYSTPADPHYGFVFMNMRFEIFNENEGVVYHQGGADRRGLANMYEKKISGSSKNLNTFAAELKDTIATYEKRLSNVAVTMTYIREERLIYVTVKGVITSIRKDYTYSTTIKVWK